MTRKFSEFQSSGDSVSLAEIGDKPFTIVGLEDSDYEKSGTKTPGVKIITKEKFNIEGEDCNKFHTTRTAVASKLRSIDEEGNVTNQEIHEALKDGEEIGPVKCVKVKSQSGGQDYFVLEDAS